MSTLFNLGNRETIVLDGIVVNLITRLVIPANAGIQQNKQPRAADKKLWCPASRE